MSTNLGTPQSTVIWTESGQASSLRCIHCGGTVDLPTWQPRIRCPHCWTLGYPDRSGCNLLPLSWECNACGALNDGSVNFCVECGTGLASRCARCERPVYTAVCNHCGAHQGRLIRMRTIEAQREEWVPILRERIQQQRAQAELAASRHYNPTYGVREWRAIDTSMRQAVEQRQRRHATRQQAHRPRQRSFWGWMLMLMGAAMLIGFNFNQIGTVAGKLSSSIHLAAWLEEMQIQMGTNVSSVLGVIWLFVTAWWNALAVSLSNPPRPDDIEYAYLFATAVFGLALLPMLLYLLGRLVHRLFP